jgi:soluble lytic murein transglycosylase
MKYSLFFISIVFIISLSFSSCIKEEKIGKPSPVPSLTVNEVRSSEDILIKSSILMEEKDIEGAIKKLQSLKIEGKDKLNRDRKNFLLSLCYMEKNQRDKSSDLLKDITYLPEYRDFFIFRSYINKDEHKVLREMEEIVKKYPASPVASEAFFITGNLFYEKKNYNKAIDYYKKAIKTEKKFNFFPEVYYRLARSYEKQKKWPEALSYYSKITYLYPFSPVSEIAVKRVSYYVKKKKLRPYKPSGEELLTAGREYEKKNRQGKALVYYRKYTALYPKKSLSEGIYYHRALCEFSSGSYEEGLSLLRQTVRHGGPMAPKALYKLYEGSAEGMKYVARTYPGTDTGSKAQYMAGYYLEREGHISEAIKEYRLAGKLFPKGSWGDASYWQLGRIYYKQKLYSNARDSFLHAIALYPHNEWSGQCLFWLAKCEEKLGKKKEAFELYKKVVNSYDHTYYAYRARAKLISSGYNEYMLDVKEPLSFPEGLRQTFKGSFNDIHYKNFTELCHFGLYDYAENELILTKFPENKKEEKIFASALIICGYGNYYDAIELISFDYEEMTGSGFYNHIPLPVHYVNYPLAWKDIIYREASLIDPCLVSGLIREESHYKSSISSWAGAIGLMQIMPETGQHIASQKGVKITDYDLKDPNINIPFGIYYLSSVYKDLYDNEVLALAGYNGGPGNAGHWWKTRYNGDIDEFVENIPYRETRDYVKRVLRSYWEYKRLYDKAQPDYLSVYD